MIVPCRIPRAGASPTILGKNRKKAISHLGFLFLPGRLGEFSTFAFFESLSFCGFSFPTHPHPRLQSYCVALRNFTVRQMCAWRPPLVQKYKRAPIPEKLAFFFSAFSK